MGKDGNVNPNRRNLNEEDPRSAVLIKTNAIISFAQNT